MHPIAYLPAKRNEFRALLKSGERSSDKFRRSRSARIAHELKNCMSVLVLAFASLDSPPSDSSFAAQPRKEMFDKALSEMNRLVDELVELVHDGTDGPGTVGREK
jgi:vacuolar-type H+-ATPase subunit D/Vma8